MFTHQIWVSAEAQAGFLLTGVPSILEGAPTREGKRFYYRYTSRVESPAYLSNGFVPMPDVKHYRHEIRNDYGNIVSVDGSLTGLWQAERRDGFEQSSPWWIDF